MVDYFLLATYNETKKRENNMKKFWIGSALAMIAIIALGLILKSVSNTRECKNYLILIGDCYVDYLDEKNRYSQIEDKTSDSANETKEHANYWSGQTLYWIRFMEENNDPELITKCMPKLSIEQMQNLDAAFDYYTENIDFVNETYGTPEPQQ